MTHATDTPRFGQADLSNCERELIHLAGSIQPHGAMLVLAEPGHQLLQHSSNFESLIGIAPAELQAHGIEQLGLGFIRALRELTATAALAAPQPARVTLDVRGRMIATTILVHRPPAGGLVVEFDDIAPGAARRATPALAPRLTTAVNRFAAQHSIPALANAVVEEVKALIGYDRVMVYRFDGDGHGEVIAEECEPELEPFLHRHYPKTDIPERARELYLRNKVRVLVDVNYEPSPLEPRLNPQTGEDLDLSMSVLRSISPLHLQYLRNMGVTATLVASLIHEGRLWGLISCHHGQPLALPTELRAACELLAEVVSTRISALEHYAEAQAELLVRRLEHRLVEATSGGGDWRRELLDSPRQLLSPVNATGAALLFDGELQTIGEVPATAQLRAFFQWLETREDATLFSTSSIAKLHPPLSAMTSSAAGILAVRVGRGSGEFLAWFRGEQWQQITWAGDPNKPTEFDASMELSPRRSFAEWHELVRESSVPWTARELTIARTISSSLGDIIMQIRAVRVLIAERQLASIRTAVMQSEEPVIIVDDAGHVILVSDAVHGLFVGPHRTLETLEDIASFFETPSRLREIFDEVRQERRAWRGEVRIARLAAHPAIPVALRAEPIPGPSGELFGCVLILTDLRARQEAEAVRARLQRAIFVAQRPMLIPGTEAGAHSSPAVQALISAIWANAGTAVSEIADGADTSTVAALLQEVEAATRHAARLSAQLSRYADDAEEDPSTGG